MELAGSVAVITGGASGIGEAVAKNLVKAGLKVVLGDMKEEDLTRVVGEIKGDGGEAVGVVVDITKEDQVAKLMDTAVESFGAINVIFANAGIIADGLMIDTDKETGKVKRVMSVDAFQSVINVNLTGTFLTLREAARRMVDNGWRGVLIITSSINKVGQVGQLNYSTTKVSVALWPKILVGEFHMRGIKNIRVVGIAPGYAATPILKGMNQKALEGILKDVHIDRLVEPDELAATIKHVVENEAIDGTTIEVTGGVTYGARAIAK
jgi:3-oxoacyl-[acyl-carrier protein] reductase